MGEQLLEALQATLPVMESTHNAAAGSSARGTASRRAWFRHPLIALPQDA